MPFTFSWSKSEQTSQSGLALLSGEEKEIRLCLLVLPAELSGTPPAGERSREGPRSLAILLSFRNVTLMLVAPIRANLVSFLAGAIARLPAFFRCTVCSIFVHFVLLLTSEEGLPGVLMTGSFSATGVNRYLLLRPLMLLLDDRGRDSGVALNPEGTTGIDSAYPATWSDVRATSSSKCFNLRNAESIASRKIFLRSSFESAVEWQVRF